MDGGTGDGCRFMFLADSQLGCMATFSGVDDAAVARFAKRGMVVRPFPSTDAIDWDVARYRAAVQRANHLRPDFVIIGGDMIDATDRPDQLEAFWEVSGELDDIDLHLVPGNHDACHDGVVPTEDSLEWYVDAFGQPHHSFTKPLGQGLASFVVINSTVLDQPRKVPGAAEAELAFLEGALRDASGRGGPIVAFSHHPPFVDDADEPDTYWNLPIEARRPLLDLLAEHDVDLLLCGHRHRNDEAEHRGVAIVTSSATGFPLGLDPPGYRMVELGPTGVDHAYYGLSDPGWDAIGGRPSEERP